MDVQLKIELTFLVVVMVLARIVYVVHKVTTGFSRYAPKRSQPCKTVICIGSGGHTTEMLQLIKKVNLKNYWPRYYVMAKSDTTSLNKIKQFENIQNKKLNSDYFIITIPRSRSVGQSYITSAITTIVSIIYSIPLVIWQRPDLILCNGPGTCIPICLISFFLRCAFMCETKIIFIESFCRCNTFSLTGKILMYVADNFLVQWPNLKLKSKRVEYIGQLI